MYKALIDARSKKLRLLVLEANDSFSSGFYKFFTIFYIFNGKLGVSGDVNLFQSDFGNYALKLFFNVFKFFRIFGATQLINSFRTTFGLNRHFMDIQTFRHSTKIKQMHTNRNLARK